MAVILAFASAIIHALWNVMLKRSKDLDSASAGVFTVAMVLSALTIPFFPGTPFPNASSVYWALAAGLCEGCYFVGLVRSFERAPMGWSYSWMRGSSIAFVWPLSVLLLSESFHWVSLVSVVTVCTGLGLLGVSSNQKKSPGALAWAVVTGMFIAGFNFFYKLALTHGAQPQALFSLSMAVGLPIQTLVRLQRRTASGIRWIPDQPFLVLAAGCLCVLGFTLYLAALANTGAGAVSTIRNTSVAFAMIFSLTLGERPTVRQWTGAGLVTLGALGLGAK